MTVFVDTNVLVYARDVSDRAKNDTAIAWMEHLWTTGDGRLSTQVLQEYYVTVTRKLSPGMPAEEARSDILDLATWDPVQTGIGLLGSAWTIEDGHGLSFWDSLIVAAAISAGCDSILTEDLQHGATIGGVMVVDPFQVAAPGSA